MVRLAAGLEHGLVYANVGGVTISDPDCNVTVGVVLIRLFFSGLLHSRDLHKKWKQWCLRLTHGMSFPCTELLLFN